MKRYITLLILSNMFLLAKGQTQIGYDVTYVLHGIKDTMAWLCQVYNGEVIAIDSCKIKNDTASFQSNNTTEQGVYKIVYNDTLFTDIIVAESLIYLESTYPKIIQEMRVAHSVENKILFDYWKYYFLIQDSLDEVINMGRKLWYSSQGKPSKELDRLEQRSDTLEKRKHDYIKRLLDKYPDCFAPKFVWSFQKPDYRFYLIHGGTPYPTEEEFYRQHFFDKLDFSDTRMLYTDVMFVMINDFMRTFGKEPSSAVYISLTEEVLQLAKKNPVVYQYCIDLFVRNFEVGIWEQVFIYLIENHYLKSPLANTSLKQMYATRVKAIKNTSIGAKVPDFCGSTPQGDKKCLYKNLGTRTLLLFWSSGCEHCEEILPDLIKINEQYKEKGLKLFAFAIVDNKDSLQEAIDEFGLSFINISDYKGFTSDIIDDFNINITPVMYLLDDKGVITDKPTSIPVLYANLVVRYREQ